MVGQRFGAWRIAALHDARPWTWAWLVSDDGHHARVSVRSLSRFDCRELLAPLKTSMTKKPETQSPELNGR